MANPKGNPKNLIPVTTDRDEPLVKQIGIKVSQSTYQQLQALPNKAEFCRNAILKALDEIKKDTIPDTPK